VCGVLVRSEGSARTTASSVAGDQSTTRGKKKTDFLGSFIFFSKRKEKKRENKEREDLVLNIVVG
jgi:hypothetical protein